MENNKIRILHVAQAAGGVDRYIRMLLKYLDKERFENILVCSQDFHKEDYKELVNSFEQVKMTRAIGGNDLKAIKEVRSLIKHYTPDIVYAHSSKAGAIVRVANIGLKNYCIYNPHGWSFNMRCSAKKRIMYTVIEKLAAPFCDKVICISDAEKQSALDNKICKFALSILYKQKINNQIPRYINDISFAHKTGGLDFLNSDVGVFKLNNQFYFLGISVYDTPLKEGDRKVVGEISKLICDYLK